MRRIVAFMFLIIFSVQVLPVKELGLALAKGQFTEEVHEDGHNGENNNKLKKLSEPLPGHLDTETSVRCLKYLSNQIAIALHMSEGLPPAFVPEIPTPPPNQFSSCTPTA